MPEKLKRSVARERAFQLLFALEVNTDMDLIELPEADEELDLTYDAFARSIIDNTRDNLEEIDAKVSENLSGWTLQRISRASRTILRMSAAQMLYMQDIPASVVINEAVELAKHYGADDDYSFINGVLGSMARKLG